MRYYKCSGIWRTGIDQQVEWRSVFRTRTATLEARSVLQCVMVSSRMIIFTPCTFSALAFEQVQLRDAVGLARSRERIGLSVYWTR